MKWPTVPLGDLCSLINGRVFTPRDWSTAGVPIIRIQNLNGAPSAFNYWAGALDRQVEVKHGDVLLAWSGTPGTSFGAHRWHGPDGVLNQHIFRVDLDETRITRDWAVRAVNAQLQNLIDQAHGGVGLQHVTKAMVAKLPVLLPPVAEQQRIAAILDKADALRGKRGIALRAVGDVLEAAFHRFFGDPSRNEKGWRKVTLSDLAENVTDGEHLTPKRTAQGVKLLSARNIRNGFLDFSEVDHVSEDEYRRITRRFRPQRGDVLISCSGTIGRVATIETDEPLAFVRSVAMVRPRTELVQAKFLEHYLRTVYLQSLMTRRANASSQANLFQNQIRELPVVVPDLETQDEFLRVERSITTCANRQRKSARQFDRFLADLQHLAFRGEL